MNGIALLLTLAFAAPAADKDAEIKRLQAENRMLRAQNKALKKKLAGPTSRPATKPVSGRVVTLRVQENNPRWFTDAKLFAKEIDTRRTIARLHPKESPEAWLKRHGNFVGRGVTWKVVPSEFRVLSAADASRRYVGSVESRKRHETHLKALKKTQGEYIGNERRSDKIAQQERAIAHFERQMAQCQLLVERGGAMVTAAIRTGKEDTFTVSAVLPGVTDHDPDGTVPIRGKITHAEGTHFTVLVK